MKDKTDYVMTDIPAEPHQVVLDERGTTVTLPEDDSTTGSKTDTVSSQQEIKLTKDKFMGVLRKMLGTEQITQEQMLEMRRRFGITKASFTTKRVSPAKRKARQKMAKASRRGNRYNNSTKGQSRNSGRHS